MCPSCLTTFAQLLTEKHFVGQPHLTFLNLSFACWLVQTLLHIYKVIWPFGRLFPDWKSLILAVKRDLCGRILSRLLPAAFMFCTLVTQVRNISWKHVLPFRIESKQILLHILGNFWGGDRRLHIAMLILKYCDSHLPCKQRIHGEFRQDPG